MHCGVDSRGMRGTVLQPTNYQEDRGVGLCSEDRSQAS